MFTIFSFLMHFFHQGQIYDHLFLLSHTLLLLGRKYIIDIKYCLVPTLACRNAYVISFVRGKYMFTNPTFSCLAFVGAEIFY